MTKKSKVATCHVHTEIDVIHVNSMTCTILVVLWIKDDISFARFK